jgi:hypothetical protein
LFNFGATCYIETKSKDGYKPIETLSISHKDKKEMENTFSSLFSLLLSKGAKIYLNENGRTLEDLAGSNNQLKGMILDAPLNQFDASFAVLDKIHTLDLSNARLFSVPQSISKLSELKHLNLANNKLQVLPSFLTKLSGLVWKDLDWVQSFKHFINF